MVVTENGRDCSEEPTLSISLDSTTPDEHITIPMVSKLFGSLSLDYFVFGWASEFWRDHRRIEWR
jgi:hypothetical protein